MKFQKVKEEWTEGSCEEVEKSKKKVGSMQFIE